MTTVLVIALAVIGCGVLFPLGQVLCYGTTDYRCKLDAVVILGAQVKPDGTLSGALSDRVDRGIELYQQGWTPVLIMSGGTGKEGVSEAEAMRGYAIAHGVPTSAIIVDAEGTNTEATARNTLAIAEAQGFHRIGAVSSFYHMARIKMLFLAEGSDVYTIPATRQLEGPSIYLTTLREIPGWWYYFFKTSFG